MTVAHARALIDVDRAIVEPHDADGDARALRRMAAWAMRFTPVVAVDAPDGLWLDITGCERVHGGEARLARKVGDALGRLGFAHRVAIAPTFAAASALARFGGQDGLNARPPHPTEESLVDAVAPLPVRALRIDADVVDALAEVGVERIAEALAIPREELAARFGEGIVEAMDRMLGRSFEPIDPVRPPAPSACVREFAGPVREMAPIERTVRELAADLCALVARRGMGARAVRITLDRSDLDPVSVDIALSRATCDAAHLWTVIRPRMERIHMGFGVDRVTVRATVTGPVRHAQRGHIGLGASDGAGAMAAQDARHVAEMVDVLVGRLGPGAVTMVRPVASHDPVRAFRHEPMVGRRKKTPPIPPEAVVRSMARPTRVFARAEPARVIAVTPDGPPYRMEWRHATHEIVRAIGPERLAGEWWREMAATLTGRTRDYFRVCTREGRWVWMCREGEGTTGPAWTVRGEWM